MHSRAPFRFQFGEDGSLRSRNDRYEYRKSLYLNNMGDIEGEDQLYEEIKLEMEGQETRYCSLTVRIFKDAPRGFSPIMSVETEDGMQVESSPPDRRDGCSGWCRAARPPDADRCCTLH